MPGEGDSRQANSLTRAEREVICGQAAVSWSHRTRCSSTIATCTVASADATITQPVDPGLEMEPQAIADQGAAVVRGVDVGGAPPITGTSFFAEEFPSAQCSGSEVNGRDVMAATGTVTPDSTKFANDRVAVTRSVSGSGYGTVSGESSLQEL